MQQQIAVHWFRQDLRLSDNPALIQAANHGAVLPVYIFDDQNPGEYAIGATSRWWLHHSLESLNRTLGETGGRLAVYRGNPLDILKRLAESHRITGIFWNRCYEPWRILRDKVIRQELQRQGIRVQSHNASLLWEPWQVLKEDQSPYRVFTPFYRKGCLSADPPRLPLTRPEHIRWYLDSSAASIDSLRLLPTTGWDQKLVPHWEISEDGAHKRLQQFIADGLHDYKQGRNLPAKNNVSRLSPYLHSGEISPHQVWHQIRSQADDQHIDHFCSELGWREFSYSLLYHNPSLPVQNLQTRFDRFPWQDNQQYLKAWQQGQTGIPMVDAGMRELWQTGYMHNRVRMIVGSFLVKNLLLHWRHGERWFWDCLVDADLANNSASWQWIAGCGADAAPYFRIFNPVIQGQKFDPRGEYVRRFVPETAALPDRHVFSPWEAPELVLREAGITLGQTYPCPIVDLRESRNTALEAFQSLKNS